jgi:anti-sigma factor RsiW
MHPSKEMWQELHDGETEQPLREELEQHLTACYECRHAVALLDRQRRYVSELLDRLGGAAPERTAAEMLGRARRRASRRSMLLAAGIAFCVVTAAGASVRLGLVDGAMAFLRPPSNTVAPLPAPSTQETAGPTTSGVSFAPARELEIAFDEQQRQGAIEISLDPGSRFSIQGTTPLDYSVRKGHVSVANRGSTATYRITLPLGLAHATIRVADRVVWLKVGAKLVTNAHPAGDGTYVLPFSPKKGSQQ